MSEFDEKCGGEEWEVSSGAEQRAGEGEDSGGCGSERGKEVVVASGNGFKIATININGIRTSWTEFNGYILEHSPDILAVSETLVPPKGSEAMFMKVFLSGGREIFLGGGYGAKHDKEFIKCLHEWVSSLQPSDTFILTGDFNARATDWDRKDNYNGRALREVLPLWGASVMNDKPTCYRSNGSSTVDLFITNEPELVLEHTVGGDVNSDHAPTLATLDVNGGAENGERVFEVLQYRKADWEMFQKLVTDGLDWKELKILVQCRLNGRWRRDTRTKLEKLMVKYIQLVKEAREAAVPKKTIKIATRSTPYWWNEKLSDAMSKKETLVGQDRIQSTRRRRRAIALLNKKIRKMEQGARSSSWRSFCDNFADPKQIYALFRRSKGSVSVPSFMGPDGTICVSDDDKAEGFNDAYAEIGNRVLCLESFHEQINSNIGELREDFERGGWEDVPRMFNDASVAAVLRSLKRGSAGGMDGVRNEELRQLPSLAVLYLARLYDLLFAAGVCVKPWRLACLFPIPKGSDVHKATDLRPIALTSVFCRVFEKVLNESLTAHVLDEGLLPSDQYGFLRGKETVGITTRIAQKLRVMRGNQVRAGLFLDVCKAYNSVWHEGLLWKLRDLSIPRHYVRWMSSWLSSRKYVTRIGQSVSSERAHRTGLPQGSVLSPLLFILFFSDVILGLGSDAFLFADDATLLSKPFPAGKRLTFRGLQRDLCDVLDWGRRWLLDFSGIKTKLVLFSRCKALCREDYKLDMNGTAVAHSDRAKCLGVVFDQQYKFHHECQRRLSIFKQRMSMVMRLGGYRFGCPSRYMIRLYNSVAVPALLYNPWSFLLGPASYLKKAKALQRQFLRRVLSLPRCSGGDVAEVYARIVPLGLRIMALVAMMGVRLNSGRDVLYQEEYRLFCAGSDIERVLNRKVATWKTPFGVILRALRAHSIPVEAKGLRSASGTSPMQRSIQLPDMKQFHKRESERNRAKASDFGHAVIASIPKRDVIMFVDGGRGDDHCRAAVHVVLPQGASQDFCWDIVGRFPSSHRAELLAISKAIDLANKVGLSTTIVGDSQAAIKAVLSPRTRCPVARQIFRKLQRSESVSGLVWVPSHVGIPGNEHVDMLVTHPGESNGVVELEPTVGDFVKAIKRGTLSAWQELWSLSDHSQEAHILFPRIPPDRRHI
uniref:Reverse transcriptase domain-containing protein n=2 Tax=Lotharella globosa TaxID=91324 RepID=A0A7S3Z741_9EUKA